MRAALDEFAPDVVVIWGDDQYELFRRVDCYVVHAAREAGYEATGADLIDRSATSPFDFRFEVRDFLTDDRRWGNIATNSPYHILEQFTRHALRVAEHKVAIIFPIARLPAAHWIKGTPLKRIWLLSPRPSMPPGASSRRRQTRWRRQEGF